MQNVVTGVNMGSEFKMKSTIPILAGEHQGKIRELSQRDFKTIHRDIDWHCHPNQL